MPKAKLSALIGEIYDATLDPALWMSALERSSEFLGVRAAGLDFRDSKGWIDATTALLETSAAESVALPHDADGDRITLLVPHIRRAMLIGKTIQLNRAKADALADTFDNFVAGLFLVDATGRLVQANLSGQDMLAEESVLRAAGGRLIACDSDADRILRGLFAGADDGPGAQRIAIALAANDGQLYIAHVLPLISGARRTGGAGYTAAAVVSVRKAALDLPAAPDIIARLYGLTPTELRVLLAVFESGHGPEIANTLGISPGTVKTHLRRLFAKTGTRRQADLVKLVAAFTGHP